jgi:hypothetical protein
MSRKLFNLFVVCFLMIALIKIGLGGYQLATLPDRDEVTADDAWRAELLAPILSGQSRQVQGMVQMVLDDARRQAWRHQRQQAYDALVTGLWLVVLLSVAWQERRLRLEARP